MGQHNSSDNYSLSVDNDFINKHYTEMINYFIKMIDTNLPMEIYKKELSNKTSIIYKYADTRNMKHCSKVIDIKNTCDVLHCHLTEKFEGLYFNISFDCKASKIKYYYSLKIEWHRKV